MNFCRVFYVDLLAHLLVCLVFVRLWLLRTLFLGKTGLVVRWLVWKQPCLPFLPLCIPTFWPQKAEISNSLNSILIFNQQAFIQALLSTTIFPQRLSFFRVCLAQWHHGKGKCCLKGKCLRFRSAYF